MGSLSIWHWLIVLAVVLLLFGGGNKVSTLMGDFAKGLKSFKKNMAEDETLGHGGHPGTVTESGPQGILPPPGLGANPMPAVHPHRAPGS